ncbi:MAG: PfkB family carbohydrate kinase [Acidimicrobiia bacterium]
MPDTSHGSAPSIVVVGGLNMDIHLFGARHRAEYGLLMAERYAVEPGGKGANQSRAVARLGGSVALVGRVGDDEFGRLCVDAVVGDGVRVEGLGISPDARTGFVVIDLVEGQHVTRVFVPGANMTLTWEDVESTLIRETGCRAVLAQAEMPNDVLERLAAWCEDVEVPLYLDPVPPQAVTPDLLRRAEVVTPSKGEAGGLTGREVDDEVSARLAARDLLALGAHRVIIKLGPPGAVLAEADGDVALIPTLNVVAENETGAGDAFLATLAVARLTGASWPEAVRLGNVASALSVSRPDLHLPTWEEVTTAAEAGEAWPAAH